MTSRRAVLAFLSLVLLATTIPRAWGDDLRQDVFFCEDAIARMRNCCPSTFDADAGFSSACVYIAPSRDCMGNILPGRSPSIDITTSKCVIDATCQELVDSKCAVALPCP